MCLFVMFMCFYVAPFDSVFNILFHYVIFLYYSIIDATLGCIISRAAI